MNDEVTVRRWERWVIRLVAFYVVLLVIAAVLLFLQRVTS
jgi:hypothetical protein